MDTFRALPSPLVTYPLITFISGFTAYYFAEGLSGFRTRYLSSRLGVHLVFRSQLRNCGGVSAFEAVLYFMYVGPVAHETIQYTICHFSDYKP